MNPRDLGSAELAPPTRVLHAPLWLLVIATAVNPFTLQLFTPVLPTLGATFGVTDTTAQLTLTLYLAGVAIGQLVHGPLADRYGRRPVLLIALGAFVAAGMLGLFATNIGLLLAARFAMAVSGCAGMVLSRAIIRDTHPRDQAASALGYLIAGMAVAPMVAPAVGGLLVQIADWRILMGLPAALGAFVLLAVLWRLPETLPAPQPLPSPVGMVLAYVSLLRVPAFAAYAAVFALSTTIFFAFMGGAPYVVMTGLGLSPVVYGLSFASVSVTFILGNIAAGRLSPRLGGERMLWLGTIICVLGSITAWLAITFLPPSLWDLFGPMAVVAFGNGLSQPNAMSGVVSARPQVAATASGLAGFLQMALGAFATVVVGALETGSGHATAGAMTITGLLCIGALFAVRRLKQADRA